jgi:hypothetical protein
MCDKKWMVVETYYKHAEYSAGIIDGAGMLKEYLLDLFSAYNMRESEYEDCYDSDDAVELQNLIDLAVFVGNQRVENQRGWGLREVTEIICKNE